MANIFRYTGDEYFQVPKKLISEGLLKPLNESSKDLFIYLLYEAQEYTSPVLVRKTSDIIEWTGATGHGLTAARKQLDSAGLVKSREVSSGLWLYKIITGANVKGLNLDDVTRKELEAFFIERLGKDYQENTNGLRCKCPFHTCKRREYPLSVKLPDGDGNGGGVWHCFMCGKAGRLVELEQRFSHWSGNRIDAEEAHRRVVSFFAKMRDSIQAEKARAWAMTVL